MANEETGIAFRAPTDLHEKFKRAVAAEHRSVKGAFLNFMERRVGEYEAEANSRTSKASAA
jgi:hypothetical protein